VRAVYVNMQLGDGGNFSFLIDPNQTGEGNLSKCDSLSLVAAQRSTAKHSTADAIDSACLQHLAYRTACYELPWKCRECRGIDDGNHSGHGNVK
jgi:hypothetical protein